MTANEHHGTGRRKFLRGAAVAAAGLVAGGLLSTLPAEATRQLALPAVGTEATADLVVDGASMTIEAQPIEANFRGRSTVKVETNPDDPANSVRLRTLNTQLTAETPPSGDQPGRKITIEPDDSDAESLLKLTGSVPPKFEQTMVLKLKVTVEQAGGRIDQPLVLETKNPMTLRGTISQFPPEGDVFQLQNPVELVLPDDPDTVVATIDKFPVKVGGL